MNLDIDSRIKNLLKIIISIVLITYILYTIGPYKIISQLTDIKVEYFLLAVLVGLFNLVLSAKKWQILLRAKEEYNPFIDILKVYFIGNFFNLFLPTNVGGDVVKAHKMSKETEKSVESYSSVFMERFTGLIAVLILAVTATTLYARELPLKILVIVYVIFTPLVISVVALLMKKSLVKRFKFLYSAFFDHFNPFSLRYRLKKLYNSINLYKEKKRALGTALMISVFFQTSLIVNNYILSLALGMKVPIHFFFIFLPICVILLFLPISIRGLGVREVLYVYFFTQVGASASQSVSLSFLVQISATLISIIGGVIYICDKTKLKKSGNGSTHR